MSKIARYTGNLRAFGSDAQGLERTLFGETAQADDLTSQVTSAFLRGWGIVGPSENPSLEDFNAAMYTMSQFIAYQHQMGVPEWDANQEYYIGSLCVRAGETYASLVNSNIGSAPPSTKWTQVITSKNGLTSLGLADVNGYVGRQVGAPIVLTSTSTYTPSSATVKFVEVEIYAAGGGGAGVPAYTSSTAAIGGGASGGTWAIVRIPVSLLSSPTSVAIGIAGAPGASGGGVGGNGGVSSFGSLISCPGGLGSGFSTTTGTVNAGGANSPAAATISASVQTIATSKGAPGSPGYVVAVGSAAPGIGASGPKGSGGDGVSGSASGYGSGGAGARAISGDTTAKSGGAGSPGICIIREFA